MSRLIDYATNSYKHLFFTALLEEFRDSEFKSRVFAMSRFAIGMLAAAWYPCRVHRLSLGAQDQVAKALKQVDFIEDGLPPISKVRQALLRRRGG